MVRSGKPVNNLDMESTIKNIDEALWKAIANSPFNEIDYENLLADSPTEIRKEEMNLSIKEEPLAIPKQLYVENIFIHLLINPERSD